MRRSRILEKLRNGQNVLLSNPSFTATPITVELAGKCGIDGMWIDTEHRAFTTREVESLTLACRLTDMDAVVRIRKGEGYTAFFRPLEDGAAGIMVPHVTTREEAEWVARNAKFPPIGRRGLENVMPDADMGMVDTVEYMEHANRETFVCIQIEDAEALDNLDAIISVEGVDIIFVGPADLSLSLGIPLQFEDPKYVDAINRIAASVKKHGKYWGLPVKNVEAAEAFAAKGARLFNILSDYSLMRQGWTQVREDFDKTFPAG